MKRDLPAACGLLMVGNWLDKRIVTVDLLGDRFLEAVKTGDSVEVGSSPRTCVSGVSSRSPVVARSSG